jgi:hypothetical protein
LETINLIRKINLRAVIRMTVGIPKEEKIEERV